MTTAMLFFLLVCRLQGGLVVRQPGGRPKERTYVCSSIIVVVVVVVVVLVVVVVVVVLVRLVVRLVLTSPSTVTTT